MVSGQSIDRPLFAPALYNFKPALTGQPAHLFGQSADELEAAMVKEVDVLGNEIFSARSQ